MRANDTGQANDYSIGGPWIIPGVNLEWRLKRDSIGMSAGGGDRAPIERFAIGWGKP